MRKVIFFFISLYILFSSLFNGLLLITPVMITNIYYKNFGCAFKNIMYINIAFIIKYFLGTEMYVNSNKYVQAMFNEKNQIFLIQNHFTEIDYLFQTYFLTNLNSALKILNYKFICVAKKFVGNIFIGVGIHSLFSNDLYLTRDINIDAKNILKKHNDCDMIYMFPEGTCYNEFTKKISDEYTKNNKLFKFQYHLYPRLTGMFLLIKKNRDLRKIYDLTMIYDTIPKEKYGQVYRLYDFFYKYDFPNKIFVNIENYPIDSTIFFQEKIEFIYMNKDNFINNFNPNQNKFEKFNFNNNIALGSFIIYNLILLLSLRLFIKYELIRTFYFFQIIIYLFYFNFLY